MAQPNIKVIANKQFWLNARDFLHGAFMSVGMAVATVVYQSLTAEHFVFDIKMVWKTAASALLLYLIKNFFAPSNTTIQVKTDDPKALSAQMKEASNISIDKSPGQAPTVTTSVG